MDVVIRLGVRIEMHWPLFSIGTLQLNSSRFHVPIGNSGWMHFSGYPEPYNGITTPIHYMYISDSVGTVYFSAYTELRKHARSLLYIFYTIWVHAQH